VASLDGTIQDPVVSKFFMARRLTLASAVLVVLAVLFFTLYGYWISERARFMLRTAQEFSEKETQPTIDEIRQRFGARLQVDRARLKPCRDQ
jgi:ABC-type dipeptide/oligopeptide/nickel transport system permease component